MEAKACFTCHIVKPFNAFYKDRTKKHGIGGECQECSRARTRQWNIDHPELSKANKKKWHLAHLDAHKQRGWKAYGINLTIEEYNARLVEQDFCCRICKRGTQEFKKAFAPDHDHKTGKVRGLLCHSCNLGLGYFQDNSMRMQTAIEYLKESSCHAK